MTDTLAAEVGRWNNRYPVGTPVTAYPGIRPEDGDGERLATRTRSEAQILGGHTAVVWVEGHSACIALTHVDPVQSAEAYIPPAKYLRSDGADCCPHGTPVGPGSCEYCWELAKWEALDAVTAPPAASAPPAITQTAPRHTVDSINSDQLDALYARAEDAEAERVRWLAFIERGITEHMRFSVLRTDGTAEQLPCADWCYACRLERYETAVARVRALAVEYPAWIDTALIDTALDVPGLAPAEQSGREG